MRHFQKIILAAGFCAVFLPDLCTASQEMPAATVLDVIGGAEVLRPSALRWIPLEKKSSLPGGSKVRTGDKGSTHILFEKGLETVVKLDNNSELSLPRGSALTVFLEKGRLFVMREEGASGPFEIRTRHLRLRMGLGGCILDASKRAVRVRVYGEAVTLNTVGELAEGHQYSAHFDGERVTGKITRMIYHDSMDWQAWFRRWYEMRDDLFADQLEKEMGL